MLSTCLSYKLFVKGTDFKHLLSPVDTVLFSLVVCSRWRYTGTLEAIVILCTVVVERGFRRRRDSLLLKLGG